MKKLLLVVSIVLLLAVSGKAQHFDAEMCNFYQDQYNHYFNMYSDAMIMYAIHMDPWYYWLAMDAWWAMGSAGNSADYYCNY